MNLCNIYRLMLRDELEFPEIYNLDTIVAIHRCRETRWRFREIGAIWITLTLSMSPFDALVMPPVLSQL